MEVTEQRSGEIEVLELKGRLDAASAKALKEKVQSLVEQQRVKLVLDMGDIDFIDSSGLGVLVAALRSANKKGGDVKIAALQNKIRSIFELTRLHRVFEIFDTAETAIASFG